MQKHNIIRRIWVRLKGHDLEGDELFTSTAQKTRVDHMKATSDLVGAMIRCALLFTICGVLFAAIQAPNTDSRYLFFIALTVFGLLAVTLSFRIYWVLLFLMYPTMDKNDFKKSDQASVNLNSWKSQLQHAGMTTVGYLYYGIVSFVFVSFLLFLIVLGKDFIWNSFFEGL